MKVTGEEAFRRLKNLNLKSLLKIEGWTIILTKFINILLTIYSIKIIELKIA